MSTQLSPRYEYKVQNREPNPQQRRRWGRGPRPANPWKRGRFLALLGVLLAALIVFHSSVPDVVGNPGSLLETLLPWTGIAIFVLLVLALLRGSAIALAAMLLPIVGWGYLFGDLVVTEDHPVDYDMVVVSHNVNDVNSDPTGTALALARTRADIIALQEVTPEQLPAYAATLAADYPNLAVIGTVGLWSRYPIADQSPVDIRPASVDASWSRGLRATIVAPKGTVVVYVAHLPSVRMTLQRGMSAEPRNESAARLGAALRREPAERVLLLGDFNSTLDDRGLDPVTSQMEPARTGFDFSWPKRLPLARIDHIFGRNLTPTETWTLSPTGSDHLPVAARIKF